MIVYSQAMNECEGSLPVSLIIAEASGNNDGPRVETLRGLSFAVDSGKSCLWESSDR